MNSLHLLRIFSFVITVEWVSWFSGGVKSSSGSHYRRFSDTDHSQVKNSSVECTALALCSLWQLWAHTYTCTATHLSCVLLQFKALWYGVLVMGLTGASQQEVRVSSRKGEWKVGCSEFQLMISSSIYYWLQLFVPCMPQSPGVYIPSFIVNKTY